MSTNTTNTTNPERPPRSTVGVRRPAPPKYPHGQGSAFYDDRGMCVIEHRFGGKVYRERGDSWLEAEEKRDLRRGMVGHRASFADGGTTTLSECFADWLEHEAPISTRTGRPVAPGTMRNYLQTQRELDAAPLGRVLLIELRVRDVEAWLLELATRERHSHSRSTLSDVRARLVRAVDRAVRLEFVGTNVVARALLPAKARRRGKAQWLDRPGFAALRDELGRAEASAYERALLTTLLTGLRPGEVLGLRWTAIDLEAGTLDVCSGLQVEENGRTRKVVDELKTAASVRRVELPTDLRRVLAAERRDQIERRLAANEWHGADLVFATATGRHLNPSNMRRTMRGLVKRLDLAGVTPHELRHSFASIMLDSKMLSMPAVAHALGHTDTRMVAARYGHSLDDVVPTASILDEMAAG